MRRFLFLNVAKPAQVLFVTFCFLTVAIICFNSFVTHGSIAFAQSATQTKSSPKSGSVNWSSFGFDAQNSRFNAYEQTIGTKNVSQLTLAWSQSIIVEYASPVVANGLLYIETGSVFEAYNITTGALQWQDTFRGIAPVAAVAQGIVYIAATDSSGSHGHLYALNARSGQLLWEFTSNGTNSYTNPVVVNGIVYTTWDDDVLYAINARSGKVLWTFNAQCMYCDFAIAHGMLYLGTFKYMYALDATTGVPVWKKSFSDTNGFFSTAVAGGNVYSVSYQHVLYAFNATNGKIVWSVHAPISYTTPLAVAYGMIYGTTTHGVMYAYDASTGIVKWETPTGGEIAASPAVANHVVYIGSYDHNMYAFDAQNGKIVWTYTTGSDFIWTSPVLVNGVLYFGSDKLYAFHLVK
jgi:outer membrane protein assembly factor BamB